MKSAGDERLSSTVPPEEPIGDRVVAVLFLLAIGAFAIMLVWLVGR